MTPIFIRETYDTRGPEAALRVARNSGEEHILMEYYVLRYLRTGYVRPGEKVTKLTRAYAAQRPGVVVGKNTLTLKKAPVSTTIELAPTILLNAVKAEAAKRNADGTIKRRPTATPKRESMIVNMPQGKLTSTEQLRRLAALRAAQGSMQMAA